MKKSKSTEPHGVLEQEPSLDDDASVLNTVEAVKMWIYIITQAGRPGMRIFAPDAVRQEVGLDDGLAVSIDRVFHYCAGRLARRATSEATLVAELIGAGLQPDRSVLVVDAASMLAEVMRRTVPEQEAFNLPQIAQRLGALESLVRECLPQKV